MEVDDEKRTEGSPFDQEMTARPLRQSLDPIARSYRSSGVTLAVHFCLSNHSSETFKATDHQQIIVQESLLRVPLWGCNQAKSIHQTNWIHGDFKATIQMHPLDHTNRQSFSSDSQPTFWSEVFFSSVRTVKIPAGTLADQIFYQHHFLSNPTDVKVVFRQITSALDFCHGQGIAHRDIKPENILCGPDIQVYLADFGLATTEYQSTSFECGTRAYMGPGKIPWWSVHSGGILQPVASYNNFLNDTWSLGVVLMSLLTTRRPWDEASPADAKFNRFVMQDFRFIGGLPNEHSHYSFMLCNMLCPEDRRTSVFELVKKFDFL
ncbi:uncharacterized protein VP01_5837g1 [Puccinia sorghi]|uniref:Protein kinase domain-containing protein n=1 Tax=Puccinia sorghi TaxID=27349 RepID=A0A0L6UI60_9BASI|nr:uncharacterized protein VP01_5837g1 [Puccinia sorghi]